MAVRKASVPSTNNRRPQSSQHPNTLTTAASADIGRRDLTKLLQEYGTSGTKNFAGVLSDEYLNELSFYSAPIVYDKMRRSDSTIAALLAAYKMPLRSAKWYIQPYDDSPESLEMADFLHDNLWSFGTQTWESLLPQILTFLEFGFSWFEKVFDWMPEDGEWSGKIGWDHFAYRYQNTRFRYNTDLIKQPNGTIHHKLVSVTQLAPPDYQLVDLPVDKLLFFSRNMEGQNYDGISLLRPVYRNWYLSDVLYRIQSIGLERQAMGVPYAKWLQEADPTTIAYVKSMIENLRMDDQASIMFDGAQVEIGYMSGKFDAQAVAQAIDHHREEMMKAGLAQFVNLGTRSSSTTGSYALSQDQSEMFLDALNGEGNYLASEFFLQCIIQLLQYNFPGVERRMMPRLAHGDIGSRALGRMSMALNAFAQYGFIVPDPRTENVIREFLDLPERDEDFHEQVATAGMSMTPTNPVGTLTTKKGATDTIQSPQMTGQQPTAAKSPSNPTTPKGNGQSANGQGSINSRRNIQPAPKTRYKPLGGTKAMSERDARQHQESFIADLESIVRNPIVPDRPSIAAAKRQRPYVIGGY